MIPSIKSNTDLSNYDDMMNETEDPVKPYIDDGSNWDADF